MRFKIAVAKYKLKLRRVVVLSVILLTSLPLYLVNHLFLLLDEILFFQYRRIKLEEPVFIVGIPRSGTTFLFRTLAKDKQQFTCFKLWEILFAPAISQKLLIQSVLRLDKAIGHPLKRGIVQIHNALHKKIEHIHPIYLNSPEEDDLLLVQIFSSPFVSLLFPNSKRAMRYVHFDQMLSDKKKKRVMHFYKRCIQRHMYVFGTEKTFLSKNPSFISKIKSLKHTFPTAKYIYIQRDPQEAIPSFISLLLNLDQLLFKTTQNVLLAKVIEDMTEWYNEIYEYLSKQKPANWSLLEYAHLVQNPKQAIGKIYHKLELALASEFKKEIELINKQQAKRINAHNYQKIKEWTQALIKDQEVKIFDFTREVS